MIPLFERYCSYVIERLGNELEYVCTINEANMRLQIALVAQKYIRVMQQKAAQEETARVFQLESGDDFHPFQSVCTPEGTGSFSVPMRPQGMP